MHNETADSEWTLFDDSRVTNKGGWTNVIEYCTELQCYPTVLFFERVDEPAEFQHLRPLTIIPPLIELLYNKANDAMEGMDFEGGYTQEEILA